jgi:hypothetical protein
MGYFRGDHVWVVLHDWMTRAEKSLSSMGGKIWSRSHAARSSALVVDEADGPPCELTRRGVAATDTSIEFQTGQARVLFVLEHVAHRPALDGAEAGRWTASRPTLGAEAVARLRRRDGGYRRRLGRSQQEETET